MVGRHARHGRGRGLHLGYCTHPEGGCAQASYFDGVESVEAVDDRTIRVNFTGSKSFPYTAFVGSESPILQKAQF